MHTLTEKIRGLYAIADTAACDDDSILDKAEQVLEAGCQVLQFRDKSSDVDKRLQLARALRALCDKTGAVFIINDDAELAMQVGADGIHCGKDDIGVKECRQLFPDLLIGASCYNSIQRAQQAVSDGADYLAFGRFYTSPTKPQATPADIGTLIQARQQFTQPIVAIGGIVAENAGILISSGANAVAVISGVFSAADPYRSSREIGDLFDSLKQ